MFLIMKLFSQPFIYIHQSLQFIVIFAIYVGTGFAIKVVINLLYSLLQGPSICFHGHSYVVPNFHLISYNSLFRPLHLDSKVIRTGVNSRVIDSRSDVAVLVNVPSLTLSLIFTPQNDIVARLRLTSLHIEHFAARKVADDVEFTSAEMNEKKTTDNNIESIHSYQ